MLVERRHDRRPRKPVSRGKIACSWQASPRPQPSLENRGPQFVVKPAVQTPAGRRSGQAQREYGGFSRHMKWYGKNTVNGPCDNTNRGLCFCFRKVTTMSDHNGSKNGNSTSLRLKTGLAEMLKGGVIMDVTDAKQAEIAERAGAVAVMALERVPAQIRAEGGVARMASPKKIREIMATVSIPVMAKCRIGHFAEAQILQELGVDYID